MNNVNKNCPAQMSDGRLFTDYRPSGDVYDSMIKGAIKKGIPNNYEYRQYMIANSEIMINDTHNYLYETRLCKNCTTKNYPIKSFY
jgi:hypothetical protein